MKDIYVRKLNGELERYNSEKLKRSLRNAGADEEIRLRRDDEGVPVPAEDYSGGD